MHTVIKGNFGWVVSRRQKYEFLSLLVGKKGIFKREYKVFHHNPLHPSPRLILVKPHPFMETKRGVAMVVLKVLKGAMKVRYLLLGGAVTGGYKLNQTYEEWKKSIPDVDWVTKYLPSQAQVDGFRGTLIELKDKVKDMGLDTSSSESLAAGKQKFKLFQEWFNQRLDEAYEAAENSDLPSLRLREGLLKITDGIQSLCEDAVKEATVRALPFSSHQSESSQVRIDSLQQELIEVQLRYQKELEKLEKDNRELKKQLLLTKHYKGVSNKTIKKSLIDLYSEVLDELSEYDARAFSTQDHLPRVVVVGDQSAGKTSVLEMIAQARIFPRGAGEMMTRAPVKVTLSEGPYHVAQFKDSEREFDLTREDDLAALRTEIELRMKRSVGRGRTVSNDVISMTVKGPGLQRMVLVDLPGIISTVTKDMAPDTKEQIRKMTETHVANPNAIILCIQDGSVDAERSNVTDLVSSVDPQGKRTIFVLTKVDLAEANMTNPDRIKKILSGQLFPMKAIGYFAVVTGRGKKDESISQIKEYEEQFFRSSKLFRNSLMSQMTTKNLSLQVSECFWHMVKETVEQQADTFKASRYNLETEWKNLFPRTRELDRDELYEKARSEILDEVINLSQMPAREWEDELYSRLWSKFSDHVFEHIYYPSAQASTQTGFNTMADIRLREWAEGELADKSVEAGKECLGEVFTAFMARHSSTSENLFRPLKEAVVLAALQRHQWETKGSSVLRMIQMNVLEDRCVHDKQQWDQAISFWEMCLKDMLQKEENALKELIGPSTKEQWMYWQRVSDVQKLGRYLTNELNTIIQKDEDHNGKLSSEEILAVKNKLDQNGMITDEASITAMWRHVYRKHFLKHSLSRSNYCKKQFYLYQQHDNNYDSECNDVVLFWRVQQMMASSAKALRQQVMNREARRLDKLIKDVLDDISQDQDKKVELLTGRKVTLAEELKKVRQIQDKLEEFIQALNKEK